MNEYLIKNWITHKSFLEKLWDERWHSFYQAYRSNINKKKNLDHFNSKKTLVNFQEFFELFWLVVKVEDVKEMLKEEQIQANTRTFVKY